MKKIISIILIFLFVLTAASCGESEPPYVEPFGIVNYTNAKDYINEECFDTLSSYGASLDASNSVTDATYDISEGPVYIIAPGTYVITGSTDKNFINVNFDTAESQKVVLIFDNLFIDLSKGGYYPPVQSEGCDLTIVLRNGSVNTVMDSQGNTENGAITVKRGDLYIEGDGRLDISSENTKNAIHCGRSIYINGGNFNIKTNNHGIYGKEGLYIEGGFYSIVSNRFGLKSGDSPSELNPVNTVGDMFITNARIEISSLDNGIDVNGVLDLYGCGVKITSGQNGIKANDNAYVGVNGKNTLLIIDAGTDGLDSDFDIEITGKTDVKIKSKGDGIVGKSVSLKSDGEIYVETTADYVKNPLGDYILKDGKYVKINPLDFPNAELYGTVLSCKGIKAVDKITVARGNIAISSAEDGVHSNDFEMFGGKLNVVTDEDGVHTLKCVEIKDGELGIHKSYKGIKATTVHITGGFVQAASFSDGVDSPSVTVDDGEVYLFDKVDVGIDGAFVINGGTVLIVASSSNPSLPTKTSLNSVKCTFERPGYAMHTNYINVYGGGVFVTAKLPKGYTEKISVSLISEKLISGEYSAKLGKCDEPIKGIVSFGAMDVYDAFVQKLHK